MRWKHCIGVILKILFPIIVVVDANKIASTKLHTILLDHESVKLSWLVDWNKNEVMFNVDNAFNSNDKWFSFGFSKRGAYDQSDLCFFIKENSLFNVAVDAYIDGDNIYKDYQQDCEILRIDDRSVAFRRKFDTCDPQDFPMHEGTMYILWSHGNETLDFSRTISTSNLKRKKRTAPHDHNNHENKNMIMVQLLRADKLEIPERDINEIKITLDNVPVPAQETTYWCHIQKLDDFLKRKHHIVQFEPILVSESIVHHMEVFHCDTGVNVEIPLYSGDCNYLPAEAKVCSKVISLWAMGASTFTYPKEAGYPIGGPDFNPYIRLEVHFNNPDLISGLIDSSGINIKIASKLRQYDAAVMELGLEYTDKMAIPPGVLAFPLSGYCIAECTDIALPDDGITIFGSQLHTHLRGVRILTRHFRNGKELQEINRDDYYSHHFQEIRSLRHKPKVLPGDALITTCYYDTSEYTNTTLGGFSISDEMCVNYIQYYPATKLELCKSAVSEDSLENYFKYLRYRDHQKHISVNGARSENYRHIQWTPTRIDELFTMYIQEPLSMQCNQSNGERFPNYNWEGAPITMADIQVPLHRVEVCENYNPFGVIPLDQGKCGFLGECIY